MKTTAGPPSCCFRIRDTKVSTGRVDGSKDRGVVYTPMNVQFEWQAGDDRGRWETIAKTERRRARWWVWGLVVLALAGALLGGFLCLA